MFILLYNMITQLSFTLFYRANSQILNDFRQIVRDLARHNLRIFRLTVSGDVQPNLDLFRWLTRQDCHS
jgi:hypothetical protein